jgi:hypothetical protein
MAMTRCVCLFYLLLQGTHRVAVPGFYDQVKTMTASDKADVAAFPFSEEEEQQALGVLGFMGEYGQLTTSSPDTTL